MSSLSMNKVRGRALNANTQNTNNFSLWLEPLSHRDYPITNVNNPINNAVLMSDGTRNSVVAQPGLIYNTVRLDVSGAVNPTRWISGQTINTIFLDANDPLLYHVDASNGIVSGQIARYVYTPKSNSSKVIIEYSAYYVIGSDSQSGTDEIEAVINITTPNLTIARRRQAFRTDIGTSTRGSTIFPIMGAYTNPALSTIEFTILLNNISGNDLVYINKNASEACMKITEIAL